MKLRFFSLVLTSLFFTSSLFAAGEMTIKVQLSPAGSFDAKSTQVEGFAQKTATGVTASNVKINMKVLETGVSLRDKHLKEKLMTEQFQFATLEKAIGKDNKGQAIINVKGIKQKVTGTYKIEGQNLKAEFKTKLSLFKIDKVRYMGVGVADEVTVLVTLPIQ